MMVMTQMHQMVVTMTQMMIQSQPPPEPHYEKQIHHLDFAEGPFPALLWRAMQGIGFPLMPRYEASLFKNAQQEEEWLVAVVISVLDERYGSRME
jgi:hypothetical protein